jgi:hypothetical protein
MSAGATILAVYDSDGGNSFNIRVQPDTLTLTIATVANASGTGTPAPGLPSAKTSGGRRSIGVNARLIRVRFTGTLPPGYKMDGIIALPVLQPSIFNGYAKGQTGTYTLNTTDYDVIVVGKTPETIN